MLVNALVTTVFNTGSGLFESLGSTVIPGAVIKKIFYFSCLFFCQLQLILFVSRVSMLRLSKPPQTRNLQHHTDSPPLTFLLIVTYSVVFYWSADITATILRKIIEHIFVEFSCDTDKMKKSLLAKDIRNNRSSHQRCSMYKGVFRNFAKFTVTHLCHSLFFNKVADLRPATLLKKKALAQMFSCEFCEIFKNTFSYRTPPVAASGTTLSTSSLAKYIQDQG